MDLIHGAATKVGNNKFLIGIIIACILLGVNAYTYSQQSKENARQNEVLSLALSDRTYQNCLKANERTQIMKESLEGLYLVAAKVPLREDGSNPIDQSALQQASENLNKIEFLDCLDPNAP